MLLKDYPFTDLYLERNLDASRIRGADAGAGLVPPPDDLMDDLHKLYRIVDLQARNAPNMLDFAVPHDDVMYRVAVINDVRGAVFALRKGAMTVPLLTKCGIAEPVIDRLLGLKNGLVLIAGGFGAGKTTTAGAYVRAYTVNGALAVTLEDPPELPLSGDHGRGRCFQIQVNRKEIEAGIEGTLRMAFDMLFISEIRTPVMASEVINASINGKLIVSTIHADSAVNAVSRIMNLAADSGSGGAHAATERGMREMLGAGLAAVVYMSKLDNGMRAATDYLLGNGEVKSRIAAGELQGLQNSVNMLRNRISMNLPLDGNSR